jgi:hypothetical protein
VFECTGFRDRNRPDWEQMEKLALNLSLERRKATPGFRGNGFSRAPMSVPAEDEDEALEEAARLRE